MAKHKQRRFTFVTGLALFFLGVPAVAKSAAFAVGQLQIATQSDPRPTALRRLLWEVSQRTSVEVALEPVVVSPSDPAIFQHPFLFWSGRGEVQLDDAAIRMLRRHLNYGGTLLIDSAEAEPGGVFDRGVRWALTQILPKRSWMQVPSDHVLNKSFYLASNQMGRVLARPYVEAIVIEGRLAVIYSQNDLSGAWARDAFGRHEFEVIPGGERQREMSFRFGVNAILYALCLDYKEDLVHSPFIKKRRR